MALEVYYYEDSVCAEKVLMTLAEKGVDDWVPHHVHLFKREQFDPAYLKLNPKAQVPTVVHDGEIIRESSIICDYIDDLYPESSLKPANRAAIAQMREWIKEEDEFGFEGVASLSFAAIFRARLLEMSDADRTAYWAGQTLIDRTLRQKSCVEEGLASPYVVRALAGWERIFAKIEKTLSDGRPWLMGDDLSLAEINFAPMIARIDAMCLLPVWLDERPRTAGWWKNIKSRSSFTKANVGPAAGEEAEKYAREGSKIVEPARQQLAEHLAAYGSS
jgi:glutathione S-transferase